MTYPHGFSRRLFVTGALLAGAGCATRAPATERIAAIEQGLGGKIGLAAINTLTGAEISHRSDERFAMCSTFKASLVAAVLARAAAGRISLQDRLRYGTADLLPTSSRTSARVGEGGLDIETLCQAAIEVSDNTAANLLLQKIGGPVGLTEYFREIGDNVSRLDRMELELNTNTPGDPRDTTTPAAMLANLRRYLLTAGAVDPGSRARLITWMLNEQNGRDRIRAAAPASWKVANKPGTNTNGAVNDIAVLWPMNGAPLALCIYTNAPGATIQQSTAAIAAAAREVIAQLV